MFKSYLNESLIARAQKKKFIKINLHNLRKWTNDKHQTVDDRPFGGGLGMVLKVEPIYKAVKQIKEKSRSKKVKSYFIYAKRKKFDQKLAYKLSKLDQIIFICGRYEGVDERVAEKIADMEISIGDYDLMGGELPAMVAIETISRLIPGVLGKDAIIKRKNFKIRRIFRICAIYQAGNFYVRRKGRKWKVPKVLLSGDHKKIDEWKKSTAKLLKK